ncbi:triose-phosphate isomerase family protein [Microbacterium deminutum]|uniref:Triosephosphate isomerase n=1 Tax=Microbacterium deminutum TaxID=344164 RepID=A0ABN2QS20_9MICO
MTARATVGVSLKMYFGHREARTWFARVAEIAGRHSAIVDGSVEFFVIPTYLQIGAALEAFDGTRTIVGAQDAASEDFGPFTGEVSPAELAEVGVGVVEIGHAERRRLFAETDEVVRAKTAAVLRNGLRPVLCIGEEDQLAADDAATRTVAQLRDALDGAPDGPLIVAYEPVWAIGAPEPAPAAHIATVARALRDAVADRPGTFVIYGGSAGPGLLTAVGDAVDGLFLGRFAHDVGNLVAVLDEAAEHARSRTSEATT